jgi:hypothetical protein
MASGNNPNAMANHARKHHHGPTKNTYPDANKKCFAKPNGIGQRADEQGDNGHRDGPHGHESQSLLIAVAKISGKPAFQRQIGDSVGREAEQLDREREP